MANKVLTDRGSWTEEFYEMSKNVLRYETLKEILLSLGTIEDVSCACAELCGVIHQVTNEVILGLVLKQGNKEDTQWPVYLYGTRTFYVLYQR